MPAVAAVSAARARAGYSRLDSRQSMPDTRHHIWPWASLSGALQTVACRNGRTGHKSRLQSIKNE